MLFNKKEIPDNDLKTVNQIRGLALDMINNSKSGHVGITLGAAPIIYTLFAKHLFVNPGDADWLNKDTFIMSPGHGSALLYATLYLAGYPLEIDDLKSFREIDSKTPGHPELNRNIGVDMSTGVLGEGFATSLGFAIAETYLKAYFTSKNINLINHYTYCLVSDGDLMEGVASEAISLAGTLNLNKLIVLYDNNKTSLDGDTSLTFTENTVQKFTACGWEVIEVNDGEDIKEIDNAILKAKASTKPTLISVKTIIGKYSKFEGSNKIHGNPLNDEDVLEIKQKLGVREIPFAISSDIIESFREEINTRVAPIYDNWVKELEAVEDKTEINKLIEHDLRLELTSPDLEFAKDEELRVSLSKVLNLISNPLFMGGSCDLSSSCKTYLNNAGDYSEKNRLGRNIFYGVREHLSAAIVNGLTLSGIRSYTSTFLTFSDYMKPSIRLAALMNIPSIYIFTHDSVTIGKDGATHEPIEQLDTLRIIPNVEVYRPCDMNEMIGTFKTVLSKNEGVSIISVSRNEVQLLEKTSIKDINLGAYIVEDFDKINGILISSGEDLHTTLKVHDALLTSGIVTRVVSMPSTNLFDKQSEEYKNFLLPKELPKIAIEASTGLSYLKYVENYNNLIKIDRFGYSGSKEDVLKKLDFDIDTITDKIKNILN